MPEQTSYLSLLTVILLAVAVPAIAGQLRTVRIPTVVGEILAGIIVGQSGFNLVQVDDPWLVMLSTLGFSFLMFLAGLELDFDMLAGLAARPAANLAERLKSPVLLGAVSFGLTLVIAFGVSLALQSFGMVRDALLMTLVLSTTSLGLVLPTLKERREARTEYGQALLLAALLADFATMALISVYVIFHVNGLTLQMLVVLLILAAFFGIYRLVLRLRRHAPLEEFYNRISQAAGHLPMRVAIASAFFFISFAEQLGLEVILGAFLGGALIALVDRREESHLREQLDAMGYGFFIPIFFIMVGIRFDLRSVTGSREILVLVPILIAAAYAIKLLAAGVFRLGYDWRRTLGAGVLLSSRLSLIIAASAIALGLGVIRPGVNSAIILVALVTSTLSPLLFNRIVPPPAEPAARLTLVVGASEAAWLLAQRLCEHGSPVTLALPPGVAGPANALPGVTIERLAEISSPALRGVGAARAQSLLALVPDDAANLRLCQLARTQFGIYNVVAEVKDPANLEAYTAIGVTPVTAMGSEITVLENLANNPNVFKLLTTTVPGREISEMEVTCPDCDGLPLHSLRLPGQALIMVIQRGGNFIVPRGETRIFLNDRLTVLASAAEAEQVREILMGT